MVMPVSSRSSNAKRSMSVAGVRRENAALSSG
jgi:hypothetical protein